MYLNDEPTAKCCAKPQIKKFHNTSYLNFDGLERIDVNALCLNCSTHWYGVVGYVDRFTAKEWDAFISCESKLFNFRLEEAGHKNPNQLFKKYWINGRDVIEL